GNEMARKLGKRATAIMCDVSNLQHVEQLIDDTIRRFGKLDVMVNNAGINGNTSQDRVTIDKYPVETWLQVINIDLNGTFYCCKMAAKVMVEQKHGVIINIASVAGVVPLRLQVGFVATKAAIIRMTESMSCILGPTSTTVKYIVIS